MGYCIRAANDSKTEQNMEEWFWYDKNERE